MQIIYLYIFVYLLIVGAVRRMVWPGRGPGQEITPPKRKWNNTMRFKIKRWGANRWFWESVLSQNTTCYDYTPRNQVPFRGFQGVPRIPPNSPEAFPGYRRPGQVSGFQANKNKQNMKTHEKYRNESFCVIFFKQMQIRMKLSIWVDLVVFWLLGILGLRTKAVLADLPKYRSLRGSV